jgi:hypothetical protein
MPANPFSYMNAVKPAQFIGRKEELDTILDGITDNADSFAVTGGKHFGKTSLIHKIKHELEISNNRENRHLFLPIIVDFRRGFDSKNELYAHMLAELREALQPLTSRMGLDGYAVVSLLEESKFATHGANSTVSYAQFEEALEDLINTLESTQQKPHIVILFDEVDLLIGYDWAGNCFDQFNALLGNDTFRDQVKMVLCGTSFSNAPSMRGSPLVTVLRKVYLRPFAYSDIEKLAEALPNQPTTMLIDQVWDLSGGHPHLAQYLLHHLWREMNKNGQPGINRIVKQYPLSYGDIFRAWKSSIGATGRVVYEFLAENDCLLDEEQIRQFAKTRLHSAKRQDIEDSLMFLCAHGIAIYADDSDSNQYQVRGRMFQSWFMENRDPLQDVFDAVEEKIAEKPAPPKLVEEVEAVKNELAKPANQVREEFLQERIRNIRDMAPDILDVILATVAGGPPGAILELLRKIAKQVKAEPRTLPGS